MSKTNGEHAQVSPSESDALRQRVADLEEQLAEMVRQRDLARADLAEYEKMYCLWDEEGIAPPRRCELEEALRNPFNLEEFLAEIETEIAKKRCGG